MRGECAHAGRHVVDVFQICLEQAWTVILRTRHTQLVWMKRSDDDCFLSRARDGDVQAALATSLSEWSEACRDVALRATCLVRPIHRRVAEREYDHVAFVALYAFDIFDERSVVELVARFGRSVQASKLRIGRTSAVDGIENRKTLGKIESHDA